MCFIQAPELRIFNSLNNLQLAVGRHVLAKISSQRIPFCATCLYSLQGFLCMRLPELSSIQMSRCHKLEQRHVKAAKGGVMKVADARACVWYVCAILFCLICQCSSTVSTTVGENSSLKPVVRDKCRCCISRHQYFPRRLQWLEPQCPIRITSHGSK